jgi:hypothetical protein
MLFGENRFLTIDATIKALLYRPRNGVDCGFPDLPAYLAFAWRRVLSGSSPPTQDIVMEPSPSVNMKL